MTNQEFIKELNYREKKKKLQKDKAAHFKGIWSGLGMITTAIIYWAIEKFIFGELWKEYPRMKKFVWGGFLIIGIIGMLVAISYWIAYNKVSEELKEHERKKPRY